MKVYDFGSGPVIYDEEKKQWMPFQGQSPQGGLSGGLADTFKSNFSTGFGMGGDFMKSLAQAAIQPMKSAGKFGAEGTRYMAGAVPALIGQELQYGALKGSPDIVKELFQKTMPQNWRQAEMAKTLYGADPSRGLANFAQEYEPIWYHPEDSSKWQEVAKDPARAGLEGLKSGASIASYIPGLGAGLGKYGQSAVQAGLGGTGFIEDVKDPMEWVTKPGLSAATALATTGVIDVGGKVLKGLSGKLRGKTPGVDSTALDEVWAGKPKDLKEQFDAALFGGDTGEVKRLLPEVPESYAQKWSQEIDNVLSGKGQTGSLAETLGDESVPEEPSGLAGKIKTIADEQEVGATIRRWGGKKPTRSEGSAKLVKELIQADDFNTKGSIDDLVNSTDEVVTRDSKIVGGVANDISDRGVTMPTDDYFAYLDELHDSNPDPEYRALVNTVRENLEGVYKNVGATGGEVTPAMQYRVKQVIGDKGTWTRLSPDVEQTKGKIYKDLYKNMNDSFDDMLKTQGFDEFRPINKNLSLAINARNYANRISDTVVARKPISALDVMLVAGSIVTGNPLVGAATVGAKHIAGGPVGDKIVTSGLKTLADATGDFAWAGTQAEPAVESAIRGVPKVIGGLSGEAGQVLGSPTVQAILPRLAGLLATSEGNNILKGLQEMFTPQPAQAGFEQQMLPEEQSPQPQSQTPSSGGLSWVTTPEDMAAFQSPGYRNIGVPPEVMAGVTPGYESGGLGGTQQGGGLQGLQQQRVGFLQNMLSQGMPVNEALGLAQFIYPDPPEAAEAGSGLSATRQRDLDKLAAAEETLYALEQELPTLYPGPAGRVIGGIRGALGKVGLDTEVSTYNRQRRAALSNIARALGEVGVLTDQDIQRIEEAIPRSSDTPQEAAELLDYMKRRVGFAKNRLLEERMYGSASQVDDGTGGLGIEGMYGI